MPAASLAPKNSAISVVLVWVLAVLATIAVGIFAPTQMRAIGLLLIFGCVIIVTFAIQLFWVGQVGGFIIRSAAAISGSLVLMGIISVGLVLTTLLSS